ncbi:hypothetical protein, partial [Aquitalea palustris]|uniref:hypothetical protein n=1 Tax=Aquitalea palustris TaxID=2480983 RepID=UPI001CF075B7
WSRPPLPVAYSDTFDASGFSMTSPSPCGSGAKPQRTYSLNLAKKSIVTASLISLSISNTAGAGVFLNNKLCGFNGTTQINSTASASCTLILPAGSYQFGFCTQTSPTSTDGSVVVTPNQ